MWITVLEANLCACHNYDKGGLIMRWISFFALVIFLGWNVKAQAARTAHLPTEKNVAAVKDEKKLLIELTGKDYGKLSEQALYSELISSYQAQDELQFYTQLDSFLAKYKKSSYIDNALYLAGRLALEKKNYARAVYYFDRVIKSYPASNKVVSAEFSKGLAYRKMDLAPLALKVFQRVHKQYPGSPESFRAENELKLMRTN